jgi:hypothetical protein
MSGFQYAQCATYSYQTFDKKTVQFTNIPLKIEPKRLAVAGEGGGGEGVAEDAARDEPGP